VGYGVLYGSQYILFENKSDVFGIPMVLLND